MFTTRFDSTRRSLFHTRSSSYKVKNISIIVNLPSFKQTQTTRLETEGEGKRREEEEEVEGDEVAREADGWIGRMCGFPHVSAVGRRGLLAAKPRSRNRPPPLRNRKSHDSKRHFKEGKHRWRFKDN